MLHDILVCPVCHGQLEPSRRSVCGREYHDNDYTPIPPPDKDVQDKWTIWERLQANGAEVYDDNPAANLSVGVRADAQAFHEFSDLDGWVLDVGCGPQSRPSYAGGEFVGIDPLPAGPREFTFVQGIAEYLPFRDASFDRVLFATSLDHMLSPTRAVEEARRVVKPDGRVCVWHGESSPPPRKSLHERLAERLKGPPKLSGYDTPEGAVDPFHFSHPRFDTILGWLTDAGLVIDREHRGEDGNCLVSAAPATSVR